MLSSALLTLVLLVGPAVAQEFWPSCSRWQMGWDIGEEKRAMRTYMVAECPDDDGDLRYSILPISDCLTNTEGEMKPARMGGIAYSCADCTWRESFFTCTCGRTWGEATETTVDLNSVIRNENGIIACYDFVGIEIDDMNAMPA